MVSKCVALKRTVVYDNGGKTVDRYTVFIGRDVYTMSRNATSPQGFNQYAGSTSEVPKGRHLGRKIGMRTLPNQVKEAICERASE